MGWKKCALIDAIELIGGGTPKTSVKEYWDGEIPWLSVKDFNNDNRYVYTTEKHISEIGLKNSTTKLLQKDDIIISARGTVGEMAMIPFPMTFNQSCYGIRAKDGYDKSFIYYLIKASIGKLKVISHGSVFDTITRDTFTNIEVSIPTLAEQKIIGKILSAIDDKIEINQHINDNLLAQAQTIFKSWFVDFEPFDYKQPNDWLQGTVDDLATEIVCGKTPSTKKKEYYGNTIPFITIPDMHGKVYALNTERSLSILGVESQPKKMLPKNSIAVSCIGTAGLVTLIPFPSQTNQQINSIIPRDEISPFYVYLTMQTMSETINKLGQGGSTIANLNKTQFGKIAVLIPSIEVMHQFDNVVAPFFSMILETQQENQKLADLRDTLLPKLMSGEIDISDIQL